MIELKQAMRLGSAPQAAFVGAGGKTTAIFQLARQFDGPVLVTTTTHLAVDQVKMGDKHIETGYGKLAISDLAGVTVLTGPPAGADRLEGVNEGVLTVISQFARQHEIPLLIEADGARQRALKAPATHEPALPQFVDAVVVLAGLSALRQPLNEQWVHRPERFASLSGLNIGDEISVDAVAQVLTSPQGGLKHIPNAARRVALLNQVEGDALAGSAQKLAGLLISHYDAILAGSLRDGGQIGAVYERTAGILLAAGGSERLGSPKQLLDWRGKPFVAAAAEAGLAAGLDPLVVVTGANAEDVEAALVGLPVRIVRNADWRQGQSSSVKTGLAALPEQVGAAIFMVVDQPHLAPALLETLVAEHTRSLAPIVATQVDGQRSNPVLFDRSTFAEFAAIDGDTGGRALFAKHRVHWVEWLDAALAIDVDTLEDYNRLLNYAG